jgi:hypothetical protein
MIATDTGTIKRYWESVLTETRFITGGKILNKFEFLKGYQNLRATSSSMFVHGVVVALDSPTQRFTVQILDDPMLKKI